MKLLPKILPAVAAVALGLSAAQATVYTQFVNVAPTAQGASGQLTFNIPQFDPSLGTLNSVNLTLTPQVGDIGYQVYNLGSAATVIFAGVSSPQGSLVNALGLSAMWSSTESYQSANFTAPAGVSTGSLPFSAFTINPSSVTTGPSGFVGVGTYALVANGTATATSSGSPGSPFFYGWYGNVGGNLKVDFNFSPVPEPSCLALITLGGFIWARRAHGKRW